MNSDVEKAPFNWCYDEGELPDPLRGPTAGLPWREYQHQRNLVLERLRPFGTVGPMGSYPLDHADDDAERLWSPESDDPTFFVVDDQYPQIHVEVQTSAVITVPVLASLWALVDGLPHCGIGLAVPAVRYFYLIPGGIWFLDAEHAPARSVAEAVALPTVVSRSAA